MTIGNKSGYPGWMKAAIRKAGVYLPPADQQPDPAVTVEESIARCREWKIRAYKASQTMIRK